MSEVRRIIVSGYAETYLPEKKWCISLTAEEEKALEIPGNRTNLTDGYLGRLIAAKVGCKVVSVPLIKCDAPEGTPLGEVGDDFKAKKKEKKKKKKETPADTFGDISFYLNRNESSS